MLALASSATVVAAVPIKELYWTIERPTAGADEATLVFESASRVLALASSAMELDASLVEFLNLSSLLFCASTTASSTFIFWLAAKASVPN